MECLSPTPFILLLNTHSSLPSDLNTLERKRKRKRKRKGERERDPERFLYLMEKLKCDLCLKTFVNGRALSGHMISHHLYEEEEAHHHEIDFQTSASLSSEEEEDEPEEEEDEPEEEEDEEEDKNNLLTYGLRENPKKSIRLVDQEFSFVVEPGSGSSVILQDRESETESSKNPIRRRSKRIRRRHESPETARNGYGGPKKIKIVLPEIDAEPVSSISYTSPDEDVAYCLMMLKRDKWVVKDEEFGEDEDEFEQSDGDESDPPENNSNKKMERKSRGGRYKCETCHKVFRSYQALGGHRASHKKIRMNPIVETNAAAQEANDGKTGEEKLHECPVCYRVFNSGQALGGHKRSHVIGAAAATPEVPDRRPPPAPAANKTTRLIDTLIDLNLPAPMEDEDVSQIEFSGVSDR